MKKVVTLFACLSVLTSKAQILPNQLDIGTTGMLFSNNATLLSDGSYLLSSESLSGIDGDKTTSNYGLTDSWIVKLNASNQIQWQLSYGGSGSEDKTIIKQLSNSNLLIASSSNSPISGNKTVNTKGGNDIWLVKTDSQGSSIWQKSYGTSGNESLEDIVYISDSLICLIGNTFFQGIEGDKTENSYGSGDYWILLIDGDGNILWDRTLGGSAYESARKGMWDSINQRIYISGTSQSTISGLKTEISYGSDDIWLVNLDLNGNLINQKTIGGSGFEFPTAMIQDNVGNLLLSCSSNSPLSGTKTQNSFGEYDAWLVKLNPAFTILGDYSFGGTNRDNLMSIFVQDNNQLVLACASSSDNTGNRNIPLKGTTDCWFLGVNSSTMQIDWQTSLGGNLMDYPLAFWDNGGTYKVVALTSSPVSIDKTVSAWGETDFWVYEFSKIAGLQEISNDFNIFPNPASETLTISLPENASTTECILYDNLGKEMKRFRVSGGENLVDVSELDNGMYTLRIGSDTQKIIIE